MPYKRKKHGGAFLFYNQTVFSCFRKQATTSISLSSNRELKVLDKQKYELETTWMIAVRFLQDHTYILHFCNCVTKVF